MTSYDPDKPPHTTEWLNTDEGERVELVLAYHRRQQIVLPSPQLHAVIHVVVENQIALGEPVVAETLERLQREGLSRHDALHAVGSVAAEDVYELLREEDQAGESYRRYLDRLRTLTARDWRPAVTNEPTVGNSSNSAEVGRRVLGAQDGDILGAATAVRDRFMLEVARGGGFSLVEHLMPPRSLAAPLHRHSREDEYSFVLEGRIGAHFDGVEVFANAGDLIFKPRGEWHTFWNAGDVPARILEIISPGGFEKAFRELHAFGDALDAATVTQIAARYGVDVDFERTGPIVERHGLTF